MEEINQLKSQIQTWKNLNVFKDFSKEIAEAENRIKELEQEEVNKSKAKAKVEVNTKTKSQTDINFEIAERYFNKLDEAEEQEDDEDELYENELKNYYENWWCCPMPTNFIDCGKRDINYMDYKALALLVYFSKRKGEEVCDMLGLDYSEVEEHRYIYDNFIKENMDKFEDISNWKKQNIKKQINGLVKAKNKVVSADYTESGELYYKIMPYITKDDKLTKSGTFVTIESDILKSLISTSNSNVIKIYCFLKWFLIDYDYLDKTGEVRYIEKPLDRKFILKQIGLNCNSSKMAYSISEDIQKCLVEKHLLERRKVTTTEFGKVKTRYYYKLVPHNEWLKHWKNL